MKLFIPPLGTILKLTSDWSFSFYHESRNNSLREYLKLPLPRYYELNTPVKCELPKDALIKIDRIYIKQGAPLFDSVTFSWLKESIPSINNKKITKNIRFWVKLLDANNIECEIHEK